MCENCKKLERELIKAREHAKENYEETQKIKIKFSKLAVAYCYITANDMELV